MKPKSKETKTKIVVYKKELREVRDDGYQAPKGSTKMEFVTVTEIDMETSPELAKKVIQAVTKLLSENE